MQPDCTTLPLKTCTQCGVAKTHGEFSRESRAKDGLRSQCKECAAAYNSAYNAVYNVTHREEIAASRAAYYVTHRKERAAYKAAYYVTHREEIAAYRDEHREEIAASQAAWYVLHRTEQAAYSAAYNAEHRDERAARLAAWYGDHPESGAVYERNRRARKLGNGGTHTAADIRAQYARQKGRCFYCDEKVGKKYHVDHVMPVILGGSNGPENLVIACPTCNMSKGAKHPQNFAGRLL